MNLNFTYNGSTYEAEFSAPTDFNIHLERVMGGNIVIMLKTSGEDFAPTITMQADHRNFDYDFVGYIYPKDIKIVSSSKVDLGIITFA